MILKNPTKNEISIVHLGTNYTIKPEGTLHVSEATGKYWMRLHSFLQVTKEELKEEVKEEVKEDVKEDVEEVKEEVKEKPKSNKK